MRLSVDLAQASPAVSIRTSPADWPRQGDPRAAVRTAIPEADRIRSSIGGLDWQRDGEALKPVLDVTPSIRGDLYWRRTGDVLELSDRLEASSGSPDLSDVDIPVLVAMALGVECLPERTHLRRIGRVPPGATARFSRNGMIPKSDVAFTATLVEQPNAPMPSGSRLGELIRELEVWNSQRMVVVADGGGAGSRLLAFHRPRADSAGPATITAEHPVNGDPGGGWPRAWPVLSSRHVPAGGAVAKAAAAGASTVVTGHGFRALLTATPAELANAAPGRWTGEPSGTVRPGRGDGRRRDGRPDAVAAEVAGAWGWLTRDGAWQVGAVASASRQAWAAWSSFPDARMRELLRSWADPGVAWLRETAALHGIDLLVPAWSPSLLGALLRVPPPERLTVEHGLLVNGPLLRVNGRSPGADGDYRCRRNAARWAANPVGASALDRLAKGFLVETGMLDGDRIREAAADPFTRTRHALDLRRLCDADSWLARLA